MVTDYKKKLVQAPQDEDITELPPAKRGRPLLLPAELDIKVCNHLKALRDAGSVVNRTIIIATARGIVTHINPALLSDHGGSINLTKPWAESLLRRMGWTKRKGTKDGRNLPSPEVFGPLKDKFLADISKAITDNSIPLPMVVNFDQTGVNIVPASNWTMHPTGDTQVPISGIDDKRQITMVLANTPTGHVLPPQVIYTGTTDRCHPTFRFPPGWDITHTENHWSNEISTLRFIRQILIPYFKEQRTQLGLAANHPALVILDCFNAHRTDKVKQLFQDSNINIIFVPGNCTSELQPLDVSGNASFKAYLKAEFTSWYASQVTSQLEEDLITGIDLRLTYLKPKHASWLTTAWSKLKAEPQLSITGWEKTGISGAFPTV